VNIYAVISEPLPLGRFAESNDMAGCPWEPIVGLVRARSHGQARIIACQCDGRGFTPFDGIVFHTRLLQRDSPGPAGDVWGEDDVGDLTMSAKFPEMPEPHQYAITMFLEGNRP